MLKLLMLKLFKLKTRTLETPVLTYQNVEVCLRNNINTLRIAHKNYSELEEIWRNTSYDHRKKYFPSLLIGDQMIKVLNNSDKKHIKLTMEQIEFLFPE